MKISLLLPLLIFEGVLHTTELNKNIFSYSSDFTSGKLKKSVENIRIDKQKHFQKVVLDQDNVYRLKTFKKELSITPKILRSMINLENNLTTQNQTEFAKKKRNLINSL